MNLLIEESLQSWLRSLEAFDGLAIHTGQSSEEIPRDQPALIAACESVEMVGGPYHTARAVILLSTPSHLDIEQHRELVASLRANLTEPTGLAEAFAESAQLAGAVLNSFTESQADARWLCQAQLNLGLVAL